MESLKDVDVDVDLGSDLGLSFKLAFSKVIKQRRKELCLSQEELASMAGLHRTYVSDLERAIRNPSVLSLLHLSRALRLPAWKLLQRTEQPDWQAGHERSADTDSCSAHKS